MLSSPSCTAVPATESWVLSVAIIRLLLVICIECVDGKVTKEEKKGMYKKKKKSIVVTGNFINEDDCEWLQSGQGHNALNVSSLGEEIETTDGLHLVAWQAFGVAAIEQSLEIPGLGLDVTAHVHHTRW